MTFGIRGILRDRRFSDACPSQSREVALACGDPAALATRTTSTQLQALRIVLTDFGRWLHEAFEYAPSTNSHS